MKKGYVYSLIKLPIQGLHLGQLLLGTGHSDYNADEKLYMFQVKWDYEFLPTKYAQTILRDYIWLNKEEVVEIGKL